jgi:peptidoglycan/LPS O-acetylase OafA/YrhL
MLSCEMNHHHHPMPEESASRQSDSWDPRRPQGNNFDFLRLFLAGLVLFSHSFQALYGTAGLYQREWVWRLTRGQATAGEIAVDGFFILSGFLITHSWLSSRGFFDYLRKRVLRIYPAYLLVAVVCLLVFGPLAADDGRAYLAGWHGWGLYGLRALALKRLDLEGVLSGVPYPGMINASTWTICYEFGFYLGVAFLGALGVLQRRAVVLALFVGSIGLHAAGRHWPAYFPRREFCFHAVIPVPLAPQWLRLAPFFLAGVTFYLYRDQVARSRQFLLLSLGLLALCAVTGRGLEPALAVFGTYVLFFVAFSGRLGLSKFGRRGDLSYGLYLYAYPIQQLLVLYAGRFLNVYTLTALAFPLACGCAWVSWHAIEAPCLRLKGRGGRSTLRHGAEQSCAERPG